MGIYLKLKGGQKKGKFGLKPISNLPTPLSVGKIFWFHAHTAHARRENKFCNTFFHQRALSGSRTMSIGARVNICNNKRARVAGGVGRRRRRRSRCPENMQRAAHAIASTHSILPRVGLNID